MISTSWKIGQRLIAMFLLILMAPLFLIIGIALWRQDKEGVIFRQKRWGKGRKIFTIYKFRTMRRGAEKEQAKLRSENEADGPVFKIWKDPRHTKIGRWLSHSGLDELPQLVNVVRGEMALVGPRPLPVEEAKRVPKEYWQRYEVLPGLTSSWVVAGAHSLSFEEWMRGDVRDVREQGFGRDLVIMVKTVRGLVGENHTPGV